jgi:hypothetical protein
MKFTKIKLLPKQSQNKIKFSLFFTLDLNKTAKCFEDDKT